MKSLIEKKVEYFDIIGSIITPTVFEKIKDKTINPLDAQKTLINLNEPEFRELDGQIQSAIFDYWKRNKKEILNETEKDSSLKTFILRPVIERSPFILDFLGRIALYVDKIILVDPVTYREFLSPDNGYTQSRRKFFLTSSPFLFILREWVENGILTIVPQPSIWDKESNKTFLELVERDTKTISPSVKLVDIIESKKFTEKKITDEEEKKAALYTSEALSWKVNTSLFGSASLNSFPTTDWTEDYHYWKEILEKQGKSINPDTRILNVINNLDINWLNKIPSDFLMKITKEDKLSEMRIVLRDNLEEVSKVSDDEFEEVIKHASENIESQVKRHEEEWSDIKKEFLESVSFKALPYAVVGAISGIAASSLTVPTAAALMAGTGILSMKNAIEEIATFRQKRRKMKRNEIHLLFDLKSKGKESDIISSGKVESGFVEKWKIKESDFWKDVI